MPLDLWSLMPLFTVVAGLACLVVAATWWMLATRQLKTTRSETDGRLNLFTERLLVIESRLHELENHGRQDHDKHQDPPAHAPPGESKHGRRTQSFLAVREDRNARAEPTLIAIPDLGAGEAGSAGIAGSEFGERHGAAWTLAAAGVPPEDIARQTGQPIGQIELIVGLYRRLHTSRGSIDHARSH